MEFRKDQHETVQVEISGSRHGHGEPISALTMVIGAESSDAKASNFVDFFTRLLQRGRISLTQFVSVKGLK